MKCVKFKKNLITTRTYKPSSLAKPSWYLSKRHNRKLRKIERYMRKIDLLWNTEYLELSETPSKHIRGDYVNHLSYQLKWIKKWQHLKIIVS
jgi:hypothetical protein